jgi:hypothetical protein
MGFIRSFASHLYLIGSGKSVRFQELLVNIEITMFDEAIPHSNESKCRKHWNNYIVNSFR